VLTSDLSIVRYESGLAIPDRLTRVTHRHYLGYAERMLAAYRAGIGRPRRELHKAVAAILSGEPDCDRRRSGSFCKLLDEAGEFDVDRKGQAAALRLRVFSLAAPMHPLVVEPDKVFERSEAEAKSRIAAEIGRPWAEIEAGLYVDVIDRQPLVKFEALLEPQALLSRYNLAQVQACLYKATRMSVLASADFATIVRHAKLSRLLVDSMRISDETYRIDLSGPASVLHETRRYGVNFARFVATLVACRGWQMRASVVTPWGRPAELRLTSEDGYRSHVAKPEEFDSDVEADLAKKWGEVQEGWTLSRDAGILQSGQTTFVPDFLLRHADGREAFLEVVGFWTPQYLESKRATLKKFPDRRIVLAVQKRQAKANAEGPGVVVYGQRIKPSAVVAAVNGLFT
jgi:predicted nuclease of restriction endonuclease-like RecB superfamily